MKEVREWPHELTGNFWRHPVGRIIITVTLTGLTANTPKSESIFTAGSVGFLVFLQVVKLATLVPY